MTMWKMEKQKRKIGSKRRNEWKLKIEHNMQRERNI